MVEHVKLKAVVLVLFVVFSGAIFVLLYGAAGGRNPLSDPYTVTVTVPTAVQVVPNSDVRAAGVKVGRVDSVEVGDGQNARLKLSLDKGFAPLDRDAKLLVRTKTLLGENYLSIEPGDGKRGTVPDGGSLPITNAVDAVQIDQILDTFDAKTRKQLTGDLRNMSAVFDQRGKDLNDALGAAPPVVRDTATVAGVLAAQHQEVGRIVSQTSVTLNAFATRGRQIRTLVHEGSLAVEAAGQRDRQLAAAVDALPATLRQTQSTATRLGSFADATTPVVNSLTTAATALTPTVRDLGPAARDTRALLLRVPALVKVGDPLLYRLRRLATAGKPLVKNLRPVLQQLNPAFAYLDPYTKELGALVGNLAALANEHDSLGAIARVYPLVDRDAVNGVSPTEQKLTQQLLKLAGLDDIYEPRANPYPGPGEVGTPKPYDGSPPRVSAPDG